MLYIRKKLFITQFIGTKELTTMIDHDELFLTRTSALHEKLTAWVAAVQDQSPDELEAFMRRDPATLAEFLMQRLTCSGDGRMVTTTLTR
jgi:hypothetical protein